MRVESGIIFPSSINTGTVPLFSMTMSGLLIGSMSIVSYSSLSSSSFLRTFLQKGQFGIWYIVKVICLNSKSLFLIFTSFQNLVILYSWC